MTWLVRFGILLVSISVILLASLFFATKYYRQALRMDPANLLSLERQVKELRAENTRFSTQAAAETQAESLSMLGPDIKRAAGEGTDLEFTKERIYWTGSRLRVRFQVMNQSQTQFEGKIIVLARDRAGVRFFPKESGKVAEFGTMLRPEGGETFSMRNIRLTQATFGPYSTRAEAGDIQVLIFDETNRLVLTKTIDVPKTIPRPKPKPVAPPKALSPTSKSKAGNKESASDTHKMEANSSDKTDDRNRDGDDK